MRFGFPRYAGLGYETAGKSADPRRALIVRIFEEGVSGHAALRPGIEAQTAPKRAADAHATSTIDALIAAIRGPLGLQPDARLTDDLLEALAASPHPTARPPAGTGDDDGVVVRSGTTHIVPRADGQFPTLAESLGLADGGQAAFGRHGQIADICAQAAEGGGRRTICPKSHANGMFEIPPPFRCILK